MLENLPLNGRNFEQLILRAPGVQAVTSGVQGSFYGRAPAYSISGSRPEGQQLLLDGATIQGSGIMAPATASLGLLSA